jgi:acyl-CoA synthetase (AMP-forming)/AMP-acid ligase II
VAQHPDRTALVDGHDVRTSYAQLEERASWLAARWRAQGIGRGDRVLLAMRLDADLYASLAALWMLGAVAVFPEPALGLRGVRHAVRSVSPKGCVLNGVYRLLPWLAGEVRRIPIRLDLSAGVARLADFIDVDPDAHALISFTSGTSGLPKAIARSHGFLVAQDAALAPLLASPEHHVDLVCFPVFVVSSLGRGDTSVLPDWRIGRPGTLDPVAASLRCARTEVDRMLLSPAVAERFCSTPMPSRVSQVFVGGGPVFPDLVERIIGWTGRPEVVSVYGSTEAEPIAHLHTRPGDVEERGEGLFAGQPVEATSVRIVNDEILVAGGHVVASYLDASRNLGIKVTNDDGTVWHRTGDGGRLNDRGLWLLGRLDGRVGGLWPFEVEAAARRWSGVSRAALLPLNEEPVLVVEGDCGRIADWTASFAELGGGRGVHGGRIPVDRRHGSKIDLVALHAMMRRRGPVR